MRRALLPTASGADWPRRTFMVALVAAVSGCAFNQRRGDAPQQTLEPTPPSPPDIVAPPEAPAPKTRLPAANVSPSVSLAIDYVLEQPSDHPRSAVVDFSAHSSTPRFHVIDRASGQLLQSFRVAHGHGSEGKRDDGYAEIFSNEPGSNASSLGLYETGETYSGMHPGLSMRLDGLSPTNSNARSRFIVIHEADYMNPQSWKKKKRARPGLSDGCFAFSKSDRDAVIAYLQGSALIYASYEKLR